MSANATNLASAEAGADRARSAAVRALSQFGDDLKPDRLARAAGAAARAATAPIIDSAASLLKSYGLLASLAGVAVLYFSKGGKHKSSAAEMNGGGTRHAADVGGAFAAPIPQASALKRATDRSEPVEVSRSSAAQALRRSALALGAGSLLAAIMPRAQSDKSLGEELKRAAVSSAQNYIEGHSAEIAAEVVKTSPLLRNIGAIAAGLAVLAALSINDGSGLSNAATAPDRKLPL